MDLLLSWSDLVWGILVIAALHGIISFFLKREPNKEQRVNWSPLEAVTVTLGIYLGSQLLLAVILSIGFSIAGFDQARINQFLNDSNVANFVLSLLVSVSMFGLLFTFMRLRKTAFKAIGLVRPRPRDAGLALMGYVVYFLLAAFVVQPLIKLFTSVNLDQRQELGYQTSTTGIELVVIFIGLVVLPPIIEELVSRGFLYTGLRSKLPFVAAAIITSLVFGIAHLEGGRLNWAAVVDTFTLSLVLVYLREKTGSLWPAIGLHAIKNGIAFLVLFVFKAT